MPKLIKIGFLLLVLFFILGTASPVFALEINYPRFLGITSDMGLPALILALFKLGLALSGFAALAMFIWAGAEWMVSGAKPALLEDAKDRMKQAALGILILAGSYIFLQTINPDFTRLGVGFDAVTKTEIEKQRDKLKNVYVPTFNLLRDTASVSNGVVLYGKVDFSGDKTSEITSDVLNFDIHDSLYRNIAIYKAPKYLTSAIEQFDDKAQSMKVADGWGAILFNMWRFNTSESPFNFNRGDNWECWFSNSSDVSFGFFNEKTSSLMPFKMATDFTELNEGEVILYDRNKSGGFINSGNWTKSITGIPTNGYVDMPLDNAFDNSASSIRIIVNYIVLLYDDKDKITDHVNAPTGCNVFRGSGYYDIWGFGRSQNTEWPSYARVIKFSP